MWWDDFYKNIKKKNWFHFINFNFSYYFRSRDLKRQSENSELCHDTSNLVYFNFELKTIISFRLYKKTSKMFS